MSEELEVVQIVIEDSLFLFHENKLSIAKKDDYHGIPFFRISPLGITEEEKELYPTPELFFDVAIGPVLKQTGYFSEVCVLIFRNYTIENRFLGF